MHIHKVNLQEKFGMFSEHWNPKVVGELNGQHVKLAKLEGEFIMHKHEHEDEMFLVIEGTLLMELEDRTMEINPGEFVIIPRNTNHKPIAKSEVKVMLFEPASTLNTGDQKSVLTKTNLEKL